MSCGGLAREELGQLHGGFVVNLGVCPFTMAEIWGAFYALEFAWFIGFRKVILEIDSAAALSLIYKDVDIKHPICFGHPQGSAID